MIAKTAIARTLVLTAVLFGLTACPPPPPSGKIQPGSTGTTNGAILFGDTYVGQSSVRTLRIDEIDNAAVDIIGSLVDGNDSHAFTRMGAGPLSVRVPASGVIDAA